MDRQLGAECDNATATDSKDGYARLAREAIDGMVRACLATGGNQTSIIPFEIYTRENI